MKCCRYFRHWVGDLNKEISVKCPNDECHASGECHYHRWVAIGNMRTKEEEEMIMAQYLAGKEALKGEAIRHAIRYLRAVGEIE